MALVAKKEKPKRLTPKPEVLRELYLLSGNNCAVPDCKSVIIDRAGVVVGHVCHIEAAMPDGARFNEHQTNEQRRALSNLMLMCAGHHAQIDSKQHEPNWPVPRLQKMKEDHEKKFKGLDNSLQQAFQNGYVDTTDSLAPTSAHSFAEFERLLPDCKVRPAEAVKRRKQIAAYVDKMGKVPDEERNFMAGVIRRALKLDSHCETVCVHVEDIKGVFKIGHGRIKSLGDALARYGVGCVDFYPLRNEDRDAPHVMVSNPADVILWADIFEFCTKCGCDLDDFVLRLKFGLLDQP